MDKSSAIPSLHMFKRYFLCFLAVGRLAVAQDAPPVDAKTLLAALKQIEEKHSQSAKQMATKVLQDVTAAAANNGTAMAFYLEAIKDTSFKGQNREQTLFMEWKKKEADNLKSFEMQTAVRLHLTYLALTLQRANGATVIQLMPGLLNYTTQALGARDVVGTQEMMKRSVTDSIFVRWYGIGKTMEGLKEWETNPGNVDGMYQRTILPQMRKDKDPRVIDYWDARLQREALDARDSKRAFNAEQFDLVRRPTLLWSRAKEMAGIGLRNRAITEMFALVKGFPDHPSNAEWIAQLTTFISDPNATLSPGGE